MTEKKYYLQLMKGSIRFILILYILISSLQITVTWSSVFCLLALTGSYLFKTENDTPKLVLGNENTGKGSFNFKLLNPFKGKFGAGYLTSEQEAAISKKISDSVLYNAGSTNSILNFDIIKKKTECVFAKRARLWGSVQYDNSLTLEENIKELVPTFYKFTLAFQPLRLDAFVIELPGVIYGSNIQEFGKAVCRVLLTLREADLRRKKKEIQARLDLDEKIQQKHLNLLREKENPQLWEERGWVFEFNRTTFFVTSFAPFYPVSNSRFSFGSDDCYLLFQPELSFALHDLPEENAETNWDHPVNVRDKIRVAFKEAGREYEPPMKVKEPMVYDIVKRVHPQDDVYKWWSHN